MSEPTVTITLGAHDWGVIAGLLRVRIDEAERRLRVFPESDNPRQGNSTAYLAQLKSTVAAIDRAFGR